MVDELNATLAGLAIQDALQLDAHRFLLRFSDPPFPRLHIMIHPRLSTMHLARGIKTPTTRTELAVALTRELQGLRVRSVTRPKAERLARIDCEGGRSIVVELMGKSSDLLQLDAEERIIRRARSHARAGERYEQPRPSQRWVAVDLDAVDAAAFGAVVAEAGPSRELEPILVEKLPGFGGLLARETAWRAALGESPWNVFQELRSRSARSERAPLLYSPGPAEGLPDAVALDARNLYAAPFPLACAAALTATPMPTMNEAEAAAAACLVRHMSYVSLRGSLSGLLRQQRRRAENLERVLEVELAEAVAGGDPDRRRAELILASLHDARKEGGVVRVPDHYGPPGAMIEIPIDPRLSLNENAQRYFRSARRRERASEMIPPRLAALRATIEKARAAEADVERAPSRVGLESLERELQAAGLVKAFRRNERAEVGRREEYVEVRGYRTRDGFDVLIGRTAAENDHLTFKIAAPHDLWLHAAGHAGAHVIVRNPGKLAELPENAILEAAAIAAWHSKGRDEGQLDVHYAFRRHVRKGKGMSPGMVVLKRHRTVRVSPSLPGEKSRRD